MKFLILPDVSTREAAFRTGKIDMLSADWEQVKLIRKTNPELQLAEMPGAAPTIQMQVDKPPFNDIKVRKALQMALDLKTLAGTYYSGVMSGFPPPGFIRFSGYRAEYDTWPQDVKDGYAYNPDGAKKLLAEAGYPNGFQTMLTTTSASVDFLSILVDYWKKIGVTVVLDVKETAAYNSYVGAGNAVMSYPTRGAGSQWFTMNPFSGLSYRTSTHPLAYPQTRINDPYVDEMYSKVMASLNQREQEKLFQQVDMYIISKQWTIGTVPTISYLLYQPWVKDYRGVTLTSKQGQIFSRLWIDQSAKKSLVR